MNNISKVVSSDIVGLGLKLVSTALAAKDVSHCCQDVLPRLLELVGSTEGFIFVSDPRLPAEGYADRGFSEAESSDVRAACMDWFDRLTDEPEGAPLSVGFGAGAVTAFPLLVDERTLGMVGIATAEFDSPEKKDYWAHLLALLGHVFDSMASKASLERKLLHFDTFLEISSLLARTVGISESLEIVLFSSMNAVSAEAASILLLDETKQSFRFFHVEGTAKPLLGETTFKATEGVAGRVLQTLEAEIVTDVTADVQFYGQIDAETGFRTRNLIAVPLLAGSEPIGVLEVLNRSGDESFTAHDRLILSSLADQIAYAIRNAAVFDRIVDAYCKQRQGADSCDDCPQSLESWAPCKEYRERYS